MSGSVSKGLFTQRLEARLKDLHSFLWSSVNNGRAFDDVLLRNDCFHAAARSALRVTSTDPRDKVYSLLGVISAPEARLVTIDYGAAPWKVYADATHAAISASLDLGILELARRQYTSVAELPSWAADFSQPLSSTRNVKIPVLGLRARCLDITPDSASSTRLFGTWVATLSVDSRYLHIRGVRLDAIRTGVMLAAPHDFAYLLDVVLDMLDIPSNHVFTKCDGPGNGRLPRVTIEDKLCPSSNGRKYARANEPLLDFILDILGYWSQCVTLPFEWEQNGGIWQSPQAQIRDEYEQYMNGPEDWEDYEPLIFLGAYSSYATFVAGGLSIFCTEGGFVGLAPGETVTGDQLFLMRGACLPVILRPAYDNMWTFGGFAYVHGIGQGQLVCIKPDHILEDEELVLC
ncbi:hypothetical protein LTR97_009517 [Elasticomyces elasticus]|uniref:Heterokaryon incompatibility domain-containing protein n=1 Tax=Elasticomyces elasticus TaxID=574655 RepID=A0AAN7WBM9_9PEZI|nr:hypothetical protein LTR97_009517 [Elasticomyces elasticus]